jgi:hypothetical protein
VATREVVTLSRGAKGCAVAALLLLVLSVFLLLVPIEKSTSTGAQFNCGTALNPQTGQFPEAVCGKMPRRYRLEAAALAVGALVLAVGGIWVFGVDRRVQRRRVYDDD